MRNLQQPLSDYERASILTDEARRRAQSWMQNAASEGGPPIVPHVEPSTFPYGHPGFWAKITGQGKNDGAYVPGGQNNQPDNRGDYEWVLVLRTQKKDAATGATIVVWQPMDGETDVPPDPDASGGNLNPPDDPPFPHVGSVTSIEGVILNAIKDANGSRAVPIGSIVWVWPAAQRKFPDNATFSASDDEKLTGVNQEYLFAYDDSPVLRFQLLDDLYACGSARAVRLDMHLADGSSSSDTDPCGLTTQIETIFDRIGTVESSVLARTKDGMKYVAAGRLVYARWFADLQDYEPLNFGTCPCGSSSSESSSSSGSSSSGSESSSSESGCVTPESRGLDDIPGYDPNERQYLIHEHGCLQWITPGQCDESSSSEPPPTVTALLPDEGDEAGGEEIVITGTGFSGATDVDFGATPATSFNVDSETQITAVSPAGSGAVYVTVTTPAGMSEETAASEFNYVVPP